MPRTHLAVHDEGEELVADLADLKQPRPRANVALPDLICTAGVAGTAGAAWVANAGSLFAGEGRATL